MVDSTYCSAAPAKVRKTRAFAHIWDSLAIAVIGTIEELASSRRSQMLVREQMETNFFGPTNIIKATLPAMREKRTGHIMVLTGISMGYLQSRTDHADWIPLQSKSSRDARFRYLLRSWLGSRRLL